MKFSLPIIGGQLGQLMFWMGDNLVLGRYSTEGFASLGLAGAFSAPFLLLSSAVASAISVLIAQKSGRGESLEGTLKTFLMHGLSSSLLFLILIWILIFLLPYMGINPKLYEGTKVYLQISSFSLIGAILFQTLKEFLQGFGEILFPNLLIGSFILVNVGLDILLVFGFGPIPAMGIAGAAYATIILRTLMAIVLLIYVLRKYSLGLSIKIDLFKEVWKLGLPTSMASMMEILIFSLVTVLIGQMTVLDSAAHNIALQLATTTFYVPFALSSAASVKVGWAYGNKSWEDIENYTSGAVLLSMIFMSIAALAYILIPLPLVRIFTDKAEILEAGTYLLATVALFQIPDGLQVTLFGVLRGMNQVKKPFIWVTFSHYICGLPLGCLLAYHYNWGAKGLWVGLAVGLSVYSLCLSYLYLNEKAVLKERWV